MIKTTPTPKTSTQTDALPFKANDELSVEDALICASDILRGAIATAYECGDHLKGYQRDLAFSVVNQLQMATVMVNTSLDKFPVDRSV